MLDKTMGQAMVETDDGVSLWTATTGTGPPLILCHGGPGAFDTLEPLSSLMEDIATVHRWDQRGAGRSEVRGPYTIERFVSDIEVLRDYFGYDEWIVGGHSWGANLALLYALRHRERVGGLIYMCGTGLEWWPGHWKAYDAERRRRLGADKAKRLAVLKEMERTPEQDHEYRMLNALVEFSDRVDAEALAMQVVAHDEAFPTNTEVNAAMNAEMKSVPVENLERQCAQLGAPALVIDPLFDARPAQATDSLVAALPNVARERVATGHYPWLEEPDALRSVLRNFLFSIARGDR